MSEIIEVDDEGNLVLPRKLLGSPNPHARYAVVAECGAIRLLPADEGQLDVTQLTPQERLRRFREWLAMPKPKAPVLPDEALRRESFYD